MRRLLSRFKRCFTKPQYGNFRRTTLGLMVAGEGEHDVKSMNELFIDREDQSSLNRFITGPKWNIDEVVREGKALLLSEAGELNEPVEYKVIDDTVCRKYGARTEMVCYNHSSTLGTVLSHDHVTSLHVNGSLALPDGLKPYGDEEGCKEKGIRFKTKVQLACEVINEHIPGAKRTAWLWDPRFTCHDTVAGCGAHGHNWIGEMRGNRIAFYEGGEHHLNESLDRMRSEGRFMDVLVDGEVYQACKVDAYIPKIGCASIVMGVKASTKDVHLLCTDVADSSLEEIVHHALQRHKIDDFYKEAKSLGLGEYRFRESEAALIHALVSLAYTLLDALRRRLLRYSIEKRLLSIEAAVEWVRKKAVHLFIRKARDARLPIRSILRMIDTS